MNRVWIIGGKTGIGDAVAIRLAAEGGFDIYITGKEVDVRNRIALSEYIANNGIFDTIIYSAGVNYLSMIPGVSEFEVDEIFHTNVIGFINVLHELTYHQRAGKIICIVSSAADNAMRGSIAYCSSKAALKMAVKCAAREMAPKWSVIGVSPIAVDRTPMTAYIDKAVPALRGWTEQQARDYELSGIPMGRRPDKTEVADLILDIITMSDFLSGSIIDFGGGK